MAVLDPLYNPRAVEPNIYADWEASGAFRSNAEGAPPERTFCIVIPPPNVTGALHLGHALNNTLQDILIRWHRMRGFNTLWQPGTDHAGIATQAVVERRIRETEGKTRYQLGDTLEECREELVRRIWQWKDQYEKRIISQLKLMGCSCDWERTRFTLDEGLARAVRHQFFRLFKDGLIFRGKRLVNWDTQLQTAVSDDEVYYDKVKGHFYYIRYPVVQAEPQATEPRASARATPPDANDASNATPATGEPEYVVIATTRPETMLADVAVAVHPDPERFFTRTERELKEQLDRLARRSSKEAQEVQAKLEALAARRDSHLALLVRLRDMAHAGRKLRLPLVDREIPLICDEWADPTLGTGCVKITPAHDPNDYEVGLRHKLPMINVLTPDGKIARLVEPDGTVNPHSGEYEGLAFSGEGRRKVVADLEARGLLDRIEDHEMEIGHSDRSKLPIEPYLSDQWFLRTGDTPEPRASARAMPPDSDAQDPARANHGAASRHVAPAAHRRPTPDLSLGATLLTWTTYGTWLPGDERGSVSRAERPTGHQELRNLPGEPYDDYDPARTSGSRERMEGQPVHLTGDQARRLLWSIAETAQRHGLELLAIAIMRNHVHALCQGLQHGEEMLQLLKGNASRLLNLEFQLANAPRWWTKSGSRRRIKAGIDLTAAIEYVQTQQYPLILWSFDQESGEAVEIIDAARTMATGGDQAEHETGRRDIARAEARGSGGVTLGDGSTAAGMAQAAMDVVQDGRIQVFPSRYAKSYLDWLSEKRDWCISRQLWWGHRIPVWYIPPMNAHLPDDVKIDLQLKRSDAATRLDKWNQAKSVAYDRRHYDAMRQFGISAEWPLYCRWCPAPDIEGEFHGLASDCQFIQDPDVLDTWFSSALWPFSTLGWPEETPHLKQYYPTSVLCTSRDIITNWVARMVMFGLYSMGQVPFRHVYIHPKILDGRGETMSKSKGNGVDPVDIIETHGADALRYTLADMTTETQDIRLPVEYLCPHCGKLTQQAAALKAEEQNRKSRGLKLERAIQPADCVRVRCTNKECGREFATQWADDALKAELGVGRETSDKFELGRNFCNKVWNAARFALMNLEGTPCERLDVAALPPEDRWILAKLSQTCRSFHAALSAYQFSAAVKELREFFWDCLCDWYIELTKRRLTGADDSADAIVRNRQSTFDNRHSAAARQVLAFCLDQSLRLFHPIIPFITERLWQHLGEVAPRRGLPGIAELTTDTPLILAPFPPEGGYPALDDDAMVVTFSELQDATRGVRDLRTKCNVPPRERVTATVVVPTEHLAGFRAHAHIVQHMAGIGTLHVVPAATRPANAASIAIRSLRIYVHDISDDAAERDRATKALAKVEKQIAARQGKLSNEKFLAHADAEVVEAERARLAELEAERDSLRAHLAELG